MPQSILLASVLQALVEFIMDIITLKDEKWIWAVSIAFAIFALKVFPPMIIRWREERSAARYAQSSRAFDQYQKERMKMTAEQIREEQKRDQQRAREFEEYRSLQDLKRGRRIQQVLALLLIVFAIVFVVIVVKRVAQD